MNLFADEGVDRLAVDRLRQDGRDVVCMAELSPSVADEEVLRRANAGSAVLLTVDKDFGELVFRQGLVHAGVVILSVREAAEPQTGRGDADEGR